MAFKEKALKRLTEKLNAAQVTWAMGGGWLMEHLGVREGFHNFDVYAAPSHREKADKVLTRLGMRGTPVENDGVFECTYHFDGAEITLHCGLAPVWQGESYPVVLNEASVMRRDTILGVDVPLMYPEDWLVIYHLLGRDAEAARLADWFRAHPAEHPERITLVTEKPLPEALLAAVKEEIA